MTDEAILAQCEVHICKSSGPGGQHRNKVSSAVRLRHRPTGVRAGGEESRSQHLNKTLALRRLRMNIACSVRRPIDTSPREIPPVVRECMFSRRRADLPEHQQLKVGAKDRRFWQVAAFLLDVLAALDGRLSEAAAYVGITTGNLADMLKSDRHLFAAAQQLRKRLGQRPLN